MNWFYKLNENSITHSNLKHKILLFSASLRTFVGNLARTGQKFTFVSSQLSKNSLKIFRSCSCFFMVFSFFCCSENVVILHLPQKNFAAIQYSKWPTDQVWCSCNGASGLFLKNKKAKTSLHRDSFFARISNIWNVSPDNIRAEKELPSFVKKLKSFFYLRLIKVFLSFHSMGACKCFNFVCL